MSLYDSSNNFNFLVNIALISDQADAGRYSDVDVEQTVGGAPH